LLVKFLSLRTFDTRIQEAVVCYLLCSYFRNHDVSPLCKSNQGFRFPSVNYPRILLLVAVTENAESVSASAKSEALAISLESREKLFRGKTANLSRTLSFRDFTIEFVKPHSV
jgi:hypothetical protein